MPEIRRRRFFVDRFQIRVIVMQWGYLVLFFFAQAVLIFGPLSRKLAEGGAHGEEQSATATLFLELHRTFWPVLFVILTAAAAHSVILSHRLVGPLVRVRHVLRALTAGDRPEKVILRSKDYLTEEAELLEKLSFALREKESAETRRWEEFRNLVEGLEVAAHNERWDACTPIIQSMKEGCEASILVEETAEGIPV